MAENAALAKARKAAYDREYRARNKERIAANKRAYVVANNEQEQARASAWVEANKERSLDIKRAWRERNPTQKKPKVLLAPGVKKERAVARVQRWREANPEKYATQIARKLPKKRTESQKVAHAATQTLRARRMQRAMPSWADKDKINEVYLGAHRAGMHVDHYYPLQGKTVCGLHVHQNLQPLPPRENYRKRNKMPQESKNA